MKTMHPICFLYSNHDKKPDSLSATIPGKKSKLCRKTRDDFSPVDLRIDIKGCFLDSLSQYAGGKSKGIVAESYLTCRSR